MHKRENEEMMGENEAFLEVYHRYGGMVYQSVMAWTGNCCLAEDFCQQIFLKYFENRDLVRKGEELAWLMTVGKHLMIDFYRKPARTREIPIPDESIREFGSEQTDPARCYEQREFLDRVMTALHEKNRDWYEAIYLVAFLHLPEKTAAEQLCISIDLLRTRIHRGRQYLRRLFGDEWNEHGF